MRGTVAAWALVGCVAMGSAGALVPGLLPGLATWERQWPGTSEDLADVAFADADAGWAVGGGVIVGTRDGGATWSVQFRDARHWLTAVVARSSSEAWALGVDRALLQTTDGGATWVERDPGGWMMNQRDLAFDGSRAWMAGMDSIFLPNLFRSDDSGATWAQLGPLPPGNVEAALRGVAPVEGGAVAVGALWTGEGVALRSVDGGATWTATTGLPSLDAVSFAGPFGWAVGGGLVGGAALRSLDGGATWVPQAVTVSWLHGVAARDVNTALAVGEDGAILGTTTGGVLWLPEPVPTAATLRAVAWAPGAPLGGEAWAVGDDGTVLHRVA